MAKPSPRQTNRDLCGVNDNAPAESQTDSVCLPSITLEELGVLRPLIEALALMAANDVSATTLSSKER